MALIECTGLTKRFGSLTALDSIDLAIEPGRIVGLLGPNGSGKTTWIKLANGLLTPTSGQILINGNRPGVESKKIVSYLPDRITMQEWMNARDLIGFFGDFYENFDPRKAGEMIADLGVDPKRPIKNLSKGNVEKLQLILAMSRNALVYLLDEPIGGVDPATRDFILRTIVRNYNPNAAVIISTHLITDVEKILDEVVFIDKGKITLHSTVDDIRARNGKSVDMLFREVFRC